MDLLEQSKTCCYCEWNFMPSSVRNAPRLLKVTASGVHGRGVYAKNFIPAGTRIIEYTGRRIAWEEAEDNENDSHTFIFGLEGGKVINAAIGGNEARWINHSCDPNCEAILEKGRVFIDATRDIERGEELFYDYSLEIDEPITEKAKKAYACLCGSPNCRGTLLGL
jgi:SET domain-containing protein